MDVRAELPDDAGLLPLTWTDQPGVRWFSRFGAVVVNGDRIDVSVAGTIIASYDVKDQVTRDVALVVLASHGNVRIDRLATAFQISVETIRQLRRLYAEDGLAGVTTRPRRGQPRKVNARLRSRVERALGEGMSITDAHEHIGGKVSRSTIGAIHIAWKARVSSTDEQAPPDEVSPAAELFPTPMSAAEPVAATVEPDELGQRPTSVGEAAGPQALDERAAAHVSEEQEPGNEPGPGADEEARGARAKIRAREPMASDWVQHVGGWLMVAMLTRLGLYTCIEAARTRSTPAALRIALDALVLALAIGERAVEGVRRLATHSAPKLLRASAPPSATWVRRILGSVSAQGGGERVHFDMAVNYLRTTATVAETAPLVFYVDNHMRPYTGKETVRKGWRMQDKRATPGTTDYYVHDADGRPLLRVDVPSHDSLCTWLSPIAELLRDALGPEVPILLGFDRAGALPEQMAELRDAGFDFVTYERGPYPQLSPSSYDDTFVLDGETIAFAEPRLKNLGSGRGRVRRLAYRMPNGHQVNLLAISSLAAPELYATLRLRWRQENGFKHADQRWGINQLDGRQVEPYDPKTIIPNPSRRRLDHALRIARAREGAARREWARLPAEHPGRDRWASEIAEALEMQTELEELRPALPPHAPLEETDLAGLLVKHRGEYKALIDAVRIACANAETELAYLLAPHLPRPAEAKKVLLNLLQAPGAVEVGRDSITVSLLPAGTRREMRAIAALLDECNTWRLTLPGDTGERRLRFRLQV